MVRTVPLATVISEYEPLLLVVVIFLEFREETCE